MKEIKIVRRVVIVTISLIVILSGLVIKYVIPNMKDQSISLEDSMYTFLQNQNNQRAVYTAASQLNNGSSANTCVYFISEVLRRNNYDVPKDICNTSQIISYLESKGWQRDDNYQDLKAGDICFTTDAKGNKNGIPTHTYIFMRWVKEGSYDYAYICDNQAKDYNNKVYHERNIKITGEANGYSKDAFSFFMRAPEEQS